MKFCFFRMAKPFQFAAVGIDIDGPTLSDAAVNADCSHNPPDQFNPNPVVVRVANLNRLLALGIFDVAATNDGMKRFLMDPTIPLPPHTVSGIGSATGEGLDGTNGARIPVESLEMYARAILFNRALEIGDAVVLVATKIAERAGALKSIDDHAAQPYFETWMPATARKVASYVASNPATGFRVNVIPVVDAEIYALPEFEAQQRVVADLLSTIIPDTKDNQIYRNYALDQVTLMRCFCAGNVVPLPGGGIAHAAIKLGWHDSTAENNIRGSEKLFDGLPGQEGMMQAYGKPRIMVPQRDDDRLCRPPYASLEREKYVISLRSDLPDELNDHLHGLENYTDRDHKDFRGQYMAWTTRLVEFVRIMDLAFPTLLENAAAEMTELCKLGPDGEAWKALKKQGQKKQTEFLTHQVAFVRAQCEFLRRHLTVILAEFGCSREEIGLPVKED